MSITVDTPQAPPVPGVDRPTLLEAARAMEPMLLAAEEVIENERRVPQAITDAMYENGIYRAFLPYELGGIEAHPLEWLDSHSTLDAPIALIAHPTPLSSRKPLTSHRVFGCV